MNAQALFWSFGVAKARRAIEPVVIHRGMRPMGFEVADNLQGGKSSLRPYGNIYNPNRLPSSNKLIGVAFF